MCQPRQGTSNCLCLIGGRGTPVAARPDGPGQVKGESSSDTGGSCVVNEGITRTFAKDDRRPEEEIASRHIQITQTTIEGEVRKEGLKS